MSGLKCIAIDHGNGHVKGKSGTKQFTILSSYARSAAFPQDKLTGNEYDLDKFISNKYEDEIYVWGKDVLEGESYTSTYTSEDRYLQKPYKLLTEFSLASLVNESMSEVMVFTGVPSREKGTKAEQDLIKAFKGTHVVNMNGLDKVINVVDVKVLNQPLGTVLSMYLSGDGTVQDESYAQKRVAIVDIGSGTTDIDSVQKMSVVEGDRDTLTLGMFSAYRRIADFINKENPNARATPQKVEKQMNGDKYVISDRATVDIKKEKEEAYRELAEDIINGINQRWTNRTQFDRILLSGGGAMHLHKYFKEWEKDIILVDNPGMANAIGFYRYGKFFLKQLAETAATKE